MALRTNTPVIAQNSPNIDTTILREWKIFDQAWPGGFGLLAGNVMRVPEDDVHEDREDETRYGHYYENIAPGWDNPQQLRRDDGSQPETE